MDYKNKYYWSFQIETSRFGGVMGPSCDYVTEENREAWQRFIQNKINELMTPETMDSPKFKEYLKKAWQEIMETECHQDYGMLSKTLL